MNPVRAAIRAKLLDDTDLTDLLSAEDAVYYALAPDEAVLPYVVYQAMTPGGLLWAFAGEPLETAEWMVKAIAETDGEAEDIAIEIKRILSKTELAIDGYNNQLCIRTRNVPLYPEVKDGSRYSHEGAVFKITIEEQA